MSEVDLSVYSRLLGSLVNELGPSYRSKIARVYADAVNEIVGESSYKNDDCHQLKEDGIMDLGRLISDCEVDEIVHYFKTKKCYPCHVAGQPSFEGSELEEIKGVSHFASYQLSDVLNAPVLDKIFTSSYVLSLVESYLESPATLYSLNAWWSLTGMNESAAVTHNYHRDPDDVKFCTLFVYLTDVNVHKAPHYYVKGSHNYDGFKEVFTRRFKNNGVSEEAIERAFSNTYYKDGNCYDVQSVVDDYFSDRVVCMEGEKGTAFLADTYGLHKGSNPVEGGRLVAWARYGMGVNNSCYVNHTSPECDIGSSSLYLKHEYLTRVLCK